MSRSAHLPDSVAASSEQWPNLVTNWVLSLPFGPVMGCHSTSPLTTLHGEYPTSFRSQLDSHSSWSLSSIRKALVICSRDTRNPQTEFFWFWPDYDLPLRQTRRSEQSSMNLLPRGSTVVVTTQVMLASSRTRRCESDSSWDSTRQVFSR